MMVLLLITLITCVRMYALFSHITSSLCLSLTKRSASSAKLIEAASKHLSSTHHRKIKSFIRDTELSTTQTKQESMGTLAFSGSSS